MQRHLLYLFAIVFFIPVFLNAQSLHKQKAVPMLPPAHPGLNVTTDSEGNTTDAPTKSQQVEIGDTYFDIQSYGSTGHRIYDNNNGTRYAGWQFSAEQSSWTDRGTAVNISTDGEWAEQERVEGAFRGGFPSYAVNSQGDQFVSSHINDGSWKLGFHSKQSGADSWTQGTIPTNTPSGMVWGKIAIGGDNEEIIHAVGITLAEDFGGTIYDGLRQHPLYFRSDDKGATWSITDMKLPGIDSTKYLDIDAEAYTIEANGDVVAISFVPSWGDAVLVKSNDGGGTWTNTIIHDFPLDKYDDSFAYTPEDTGADLDDPDLPDSLAILSTDGHASMIIDDEGTVHVTVGRMYYSADGLGGRFFFPGTDGIFYWSDAVDEPFSIIATLQDFDMDDSIGGADIAVYQRSLTGMPSMGMDSDGNIYVTYSAYHELYIDSDDDQNFRQVYIIKSTDGGVTWTEPIAVINADTFIEDFIPEVEGVFPQIPAKIGESIPLIYQQDFRPGLLSWGDEDPPELASVVMVDLNKEDCSAIGTSSVLVTNNNISAEVFPNITTDQIFMEYTPTTSSKVNYEVISSTGQRILKGTTRSVSNAIYQETISLKNEAKGIYYIRLLTEEGQKTFKVVKK